jgi:RHS repeat-associated protein
LISLKRFFQARVLLAVWWAWPLLASAEVSATAPRSQTLADPQRQQVLGFLLLEPGRAKLFKHEQALKKTPDVIDCLVQCLVDASNSFFIFTDHLGTPFAWVKVSTGEITYTPYSPWGELLAYDPTRGPPTFPEGNIPANGIPLPDFGDFPGHLPPLGLAGHLIEQDTGLVVMHHRTYHPRLGHFLTPDFRAPDIDDPSTFTEPYAYAAGNPVMYWDPTGLIGIFFDGTWQDEAKMVNDTNVYLLYNTYTDEAGYYTGVGTKGNLLDLALGGLTGLGGKEKVEDAYDFLVKEYNEEYEKMRAGDPDADLSIDIFGFSRGAALARQLANVINERGIPILSSKKIESVYVPTRGIAKIESYGLKVKNPAIRFLGLFDTVGSFGIPGNNVNLGYDLSIPENVQFVRHATAEHETRPLYPLSSVLSYPGQRLLFTGNPGIVRTWEKSFVGTHSDIGGGNKDQDYPAKIPLEWMVQEGQAVGVPSKSIPKEHQVSPFVRGRQCEKYKHETLELYDVLLYLWTDRWNISGRTVYYYPRRKGKH